MDKPLHTIRVSNGPTLSGRSYGFRDWTPTILTVICGFAMSIGGFALAYQYQLSTEERAFAVEAARQPCRAQNPHPVDHAARL